MTKHHFLLTVNTDGRYDNKRDELTDIVGGRMWSLNGVEQEGTDCRMLSTAEMQWLNRAEVTVNNGVIELHVIGAVPGELILLPKSSYDKLQFAMRERDEMVNRAILRERGELDPG